MGLAPDFVVDHGAKEHYFKMNAEEPQYVDGGGLGGSASQ